MKRIIWNDGWKFWADRDAFALVWNVPDAAQDVTLPHDAMIGCRPYAESPNGGSTGYRDGGNYTYVKFLDVAEGDEGRRTVLKFDGAYCHALVYVNGQLAAGEANGYSAFYADLTPYLKTGRNEVRVQVRNGGMKNSRWYSGSGLYRDVYLLTSTAARIEPDGVAVSTENADEGIAVLKVRAEVVNGTAKAGRFALSARILAPGGEERARGGAPFFLAAGEKRIVELRIAVKEPLLWSEESPALYTAEAGLCEGGVEIDRETVSFGIRTLSLDAARGLRVNGRSVKLRGACVHHDSGVLGAATYYDAQKRQIAIMKEAGFNALRIAHHPAAPALLRACDEVGMYVMDEFSDMWQRAKSDLDYALDFDAWWEKDVELMVKKDFCHPSVVLYSVGNEIPEIGTDGGSALCARIASLIRRLDPTRYVTAGINGVFMAGEEIGRIMADLSRADAEAGTAPDGSVNDFLTALDSKMDRIVRHGAVTERLEMACAALDVAGYNYMAARYEEDCARYPDRVIVGSETYPPDIAGNWALVKRLPAVIGDFTWTGWDYIGEAGVGIPAYAPGEGGFGAKFPCQLAYCGDMDLTGMRRPLSYYREIVFGLRRSPYIAVQDPRRYGQAPRKTPWVMSDACASWDWPGCEGKPAVVEVYAPEGEAELFLNGRSLGRKRTEGFRALFETAYEPGVLEAAAYVNGEEAGRCALASPAGETRISLEKDYEGEELVYLRAEIRDESGNCACGREEVLTARAEGAEILGFGSGDPKPPFNYDEGKCRTHLGRALLVLKKTGKGNARVIVTGSGGTAEIGI